MIITVNSNEVCRIFDIFSLRIPKVHRNKEKQVQNLDRFVIRTTKQILTIRAECNSSNCPAMCFDYT